MHSELTGSSFRPIGAFAWPPPHPTPKPPRAQISYCSEHLLSSSQQIEERRRGGGNQRRKQEARREKKYSRAKQRGKRLEAPSTPLKHCSSPHRPPLSPTPPPPSVGQLTHSHTWHLLKKTKTKTAISHKRCTQTYPTLPGSAAFSIHWCLSSLYIILPCCQR